MGVNKAFFCCLLLFATTLSQAEKIEFAGEQRKQTAQQALDTVKDLSREIQQLKTNIVGLNKDLRLMEEELLFPSSSQVSVFVSLDIGQFFKLESIKVKLDGKQVVSHIYSDKQRNALARGGVQRLYLTNLNLGEHTLSAFFTGIGPNGRPYKRASELNFTKQKGSHYIELAVVDDFSKQEPTFVIKQW
ncbi:AraC family transcriptional regulator [Bacterioplanoides sp.]|uniref:AraC family transcriptional regulator n=1 Tax=Bacterioplanoides sp. TaxID=2066072 RepID=UPI003B5A9B20